MDTAVPIPADAFPALRGWRPCAARYAGCAGPPWFLELRDGNGRRVGEGEGETEREALLAALADALGREAARRAAR